MVSTVDVLHRARAAGKNMIITHEPAYWTGEDSIKPMTDDRLYTKKPAFTKDKDLVLWRFHDNPHLRRPDVRTLGLAHDLGWCESVSKTEQGVCLLPRTAPGELAKDVDRRTIPADCVSSAPQN